jgi:hypothetical protein
MGHSMGHPNQAAPPLSHEATSPRHRTSVAEPSLPAAGGSSSAAAWINSKLDSHRHPPLCPSIHAAAGMEEPQRADAPLDPTVEGQITRDRAAAVGAPPFSLNLPRPWPRRRKSRLPRCCGVCGGQRRGRSEREEKEEEISLTTGPTCNNGKGG